LSPSAALLAALPSSLAPSRVGHSRSQSLSVRSSASSHGRVVERQWRRLSQLNSLLVSAKSKLSLEHPASLAELQKHAAELEREGLILHEQ